MISGKFILKDFLTQLQAHGQYSFTRPDVLTALGISPLSFQRAAALLSKKGQLNRIRGEFYSIVPPEYSNQGSLPPNWFIQQFMDYLQQDYYVGLLSAASLQGATHQINTTFQVVTNKTTRAIQSGQFHIQFFNKKTIKPYYYQKIKTAGGMINVSIPEMTACDLLRYINAAGQVNHVATILCELGESLKPEILAQLLEDEDIETTVAQRLGYLLEKLNIPIDLTSLLTVLKTKEPTRQLLIRESRKPIIEHNKRWNILMNEIVEPDDL
ncbi:MAG: type IV toxin-antitoxin system AbiEi family antitoxin [Legionellales bacterium]|jgi:predicted transcriptional regulator of viral defense system